MLNRTSLTRLRISSWVFKTSIFCLLIPCPSIAATTIEEIIVTAQKREQSLQDVPLSVLAIGSEFLDDRNITSFENLELPGVHIGQGVANDNIYIRGVGSTGGRGFDQSVPLYHDGVYLSRARQQRIAFLDVERIEILKGPQPTYLGKNAIGGAISIISRRPTDQFEATLELANEFEHDEFTAFVALSGPLSDNFRMRAAAKYRDSGGWVKNVSNSRTGPAEENKLFRISAEWDVTDSFELYFKYEHAEIEEDETSRQKVLCAPNDFIDRTLDSCVLDESRAVSFNADDFPFARELGIIPPYVKDGDTFVSFVDNDAFQLIANWDIGGYMLTSSTSYYEFENRSFAKADVSTLPVTISSQPEALEQFSQEVRLASPADGRIDWLLGAYYDDIDTQVLNNAVINAAAGRGVLGPQIGLLANFSKQAESWAVFGELGFDINDAFRTVFGFRYTDVQQDGRNTTDAFFMRPTGPVPFPPFTFTEPASSDDSKFQPAVTLEWRPSEQTMWYASWKKGFKSGGPNIRLTRADPNLIFRPENVTAYEAGAKMTLLDGAATLNFALFRSEFTDLQVRSADPETLSIVTQNAGESTSQGIELDGAWAVNERVMLFANITFLDAEYDNFPGVACYALPPQTPEQGCDPETGTQDLSGSTLPFAPDFSGSFAAEYRHPLGAVLGSSSLELSTRLDFFYTDSFLIGAKNNPAQVQGSYSKIDLRIGIGPEDGHWSLAFIGRNLTNEITTHFLNDTGGGGGLSLMGLLDRPRQLGLQYRYRWF